MLFLEHLHFAVVQNIPSCLLLFRQLVEIGDAREVNFLRRLWLVSIRKGVLSAVNHLIVTFLFGSVLRSNDFVVFTDAREASQRLEP